jgi:hypothetical protein
MNEILPELAPRPTAQNPNPPRTSSGEQVHRLKHRRLRVTNPPTLATDSVNEQIENCIPTGTGIERPRFDVNAVDDAVQLRLMMNQTVEYIRVLEARLPSYRTTAQNLVRLIQDHLSREISALCEDIQQAKDACLQENLETAAQKYRSEIQRLQNDAVEDMSELSRLKALEAELDKAQKEHLLRLKTDAAAAIAVSDEAMETLAWYAERSAALHAKTTELRASYVRGDELDDIIREKLDLNESMTNAVAQINRQIERVAEDLEPFQLKIAEENAPLRRRMTSYEKKWRQWSGRSTSCGTNLMTWSVKWATVEKKRENSSRSVAFGPRKGASSRRRVCESTPPGRTTTQSLKTLQPCRN